MKKYHPLEMWSPMPKHLTFSLKISTIYLWPDFKEQQKIVSFNSLHLNFFSKRSFSTEWKKFKWISAATFCFLMNYSICFRRKLQFLKIFSQSDLVVSRCKTNKPVLQASSFLFKSKQMDLWLVFQNKIKL